MKIYVQSCISPFSSEFDMVDGNGASSCLLNILYEYGHEKFGLADSLKYLYQPFEMGPFSLPFGEMV